MFEKVKYFCQLNLIFTLFQGEDGRDGEVGARGLPGPGVSI